MTAPREEILARIEGLGAKNLQLGADIELLKRSVALRQAETSPPPDSVGAAALQQMESDLRALQHEYRDCARSNVALVQEALRRIARCSAQVDALPAGGNVTTAQLQSFRDACSREMNELLLKLEDTQHEQVDSRSNESTLDAVQHNRQEIDQLKQELRYCRQFSSRRGDGGEEKQAQSAAEEEQSASARRVKVFADDLRNEMGMLKQFLLQESGTSRSGIERLLSRQMSAFQDAQDDEAKRLQDEVDELRSELCEVLKDMHRLKERTRYLRPDCSRRAKRPRGERRQQTTGECGGGAAATHSVDPYSSSPSVPAERSSAEDRPLTAAYALAHCDHPRYCSFHYPLADFADRSEYALPHHSSESPSPSSSSQSSSPRRPSDAGMETLEPPRGEVAARVAGAAGNQSCPSPHFSSRSSSISDRLSANRGASARAVSLVGGWVVLTLVVVLWWADENHESPPEEEVERRLLEQHRLFWIKEGAGEPK